MDKLDQLSPKEQEEVDKASEMENMLLRDVIMPQVESWLEISEHGFVTGAAVSVVDFAIFHEL